MVKLSCSSLAVAFYLGVSANVLAARERCDIRDSYKKDCGFMGITENECAKKRCCWVPSNESGVPWCFKMPPAIPTPIPKPNPRMPTLSERDDRCFITGERSDCGRVGISQQECEVKGCCWNPPVKSRKGKQDPYCFYKEVPKDDDYHISRVNDVNDGFVMDLLYKGNNSAPRFEFGEPIRRLRLTITLEDTHRVHIKIMDRDKKRWEIPEDVLPLPPKSDVRGREKAMLYKVEHGPPGAPFYIKIIRLSNEETVFDSENLHFNFANQYIELGTHLAPDSNLYGLGERVDAFKLRPDTYAFHAYDVGCPLHHNLYGSHPVYMDVRQKSGHAHMLFMRNSNSMDVMLTEDTLTYKMTGGIIDLYVVMGPTPEEATRQYAHIIGKPQLPPFWCLGYHQSRWGYQSVEMLKDTIVGFKSNDIPLDVIWSDIDYMQDYKIWSWNKHNFKKEDIQAFVRDIHALNLHYVTIVDPGVKQEDGYDIYENGRKQDVFLKRRDGVEFQGKVWPGLVAFPDFFHPKTSAWWAADIARFLGPDEDDSVHVDGLWIDMNELSNFCNGACNDQSLRSLKFSHRGRQFWPNNPPYRIHNQENNGDLEQRTVSMDALHDGDIYEYDAHNLFGHMQSIATRKALESSRGKRSFIITRSTFPGTGQHAGHWTGDNHATWEDMWLSISAILNFNLYQIPLVGADICGFHNDATEELCGRWTALGAFYPFSRNHNVAGAKPQEPYRWASVSQVARQYLKMRYMLSAYYYTLFQQAHEHGSVVIRPLFFDSPNRAEALNNDRQFMVGKGLLISPVLTQGHDYVDAYFPPGQWFDLQAPNQRVDVPSQGGIKRIQAPMDKNAIGVHIKGGTILPLYSEPGKTIVETRDHSPMMLLVALDGEGRAEGELYLDDGESIHASDSVKVTFMAYDSRMKIQATRNNKACLRVQGDEEDNMNPFITKIILIGDLKRVGNEHVPPTLQIAGKKQAVTLKSQGAAWVADSLQLRLCEDNTMVWSPELKHMVDKEARVYRDAEARARVPSPRPPKGMLSFNGNNLLPPGQESIFLSLIVLASVVSVGIFAYLLRFSKEDSENKDEKYD